MDTLIWIIIAGAATGFTTELLGLLLGLWLDPRVIKQLIAAPIAGVFLWLLGMQGWELVISALASGFFSLIVLWAVNRPVQIQQVISKRMP
jgi:hypothetical protein